MFLFFLLSFFTYFLYAFLAFLSAFVSVVLALFLFSMSLYRLLLLFLPSSAQGPPRGRPQGRAPTSLFQEILLVCDLRGSPLLSLSPPPPLTLVPEGM